MAPTPTGNASLDKEPDDGGGLSSAIWFLVAVVLIFFVLNVLYGLEPRTPLVVRHADLETSRIFYNRRRRNVRSPPRNQEECTQTGPGALVGRVQPAHVQRKVKTGRIRIKELDKVAPPLTLGMWKTLPRSENTSIEEKRSAHQEDSTSIQPSHPDCTCLTPTLVLTEKSATPCSPISVADMDSIPSEPITKPAYFEKDEEGRCDGYPLCIICHDYVEDDSQVRQLQCRHLFHADCIEKWLTTCRGFCPICNRRVDISAVKS
ncbi:hypothetical protein H2202_008677 [Exophiala xenobiotica]|uniref:RING-type domain-containing protein n=1 Tax=Vermiconidia calcicola TaxID=1690605 RepID=A0AAV9Q067_9PEZI|nr:hypothetical protein H2202_008677 [Exophiala xenobiotica]KAK5531340.1 hypothetical protein LTR25_008447 [Vermiconidia calcicola]KAK5540596.1 hypothetical protein LTR23_006057 [Chaetothyriales sp. CCFEE 6169]KAK5191528.1 hypothetical protein LTR92_008701 [Exophiala xenobiotica]KAK5207213.1 hypothetical protein LTR41_007282 [Exophiala xenobiotica]